MLPHSRKITRDGRELDRLESDLRSLKIEFDKFFNGAVAVPPEAMRSRLEKRFRFMRSRHLRTFADRFRLGSLETRFNVLNELWNRRLREKEQAARRASAATASGESKGPDPFSGIRLENTEDRQGVEVLYNELYRSSGRRNKIDFDTFQRYLNQQIGRLRAETGCSQVQFRIASSQGELKLKAKPVKSSAVERSDSS